MSSFNSKDYEEFVINKDKVPVNLDEKVIGLYFSAHWCGPCRNFTPKLAEKYKEIVDAGQAFEIIFISADQTEDEALNYFKEMPWTMLNYSERAKEEELSKSCNVAGIPTLVLFDELGQLITKDGREAIMTVPFNQLKTYSQDKKAEEEKKKS